MRRCTTLTCLKHGENLNDAWKNVRSSSNYQNYFRNQKVSKKFFLLEHFSIPSLSMLKQHICQSISLVFQITFFFWSIESLKQYKACFWQNKLFPLWFWKIKINNFSYLLFSKDTMFFSSIFLNALIVDFEDPTVYV